MQQINQPFSHLSTKAAKTDQVPHMAKWQGGYIFKDEKYDTFPEFVEYFKLVGDVDIILFECINNPIGYFII